jgi:hypothetical protein
MMDWQPIDTYPSKNNQFVWALLANDQQRWIRFGYKYPKLNRWYYSTGHFEKPLLAADDTPTHWMPMIKGPWL